MFNPFRKKKLNVIMIMVDGVRYDVLSKIDSYQELKKDAVFFQNLISYAPYTIGSLHALFSGMDGNKNGVNGYYKSYSFDKKNCFTLTDYLKEAGYYTEADVINESIIPTQGFEKARSHDEFKDDLVKRHSEILMQIKNKQPFFLFLDYSKVHTNTVKNIIKKYSDFDKEYFYNKDKNFENYLKWTKESGSYLMTIIRKIKELGLYDNSIVILFTDHGTSTGDRMGEKAYGVYLYEYTLRSFLYLIGKNFPKGMEINHLIRSIDVLPTLLDIFKIKEKIDYKKIQGKSFLPFVRGNTEERIAYSETGGLGGPTPSPEVHNLQAVRTNKWKLIYNKSNKKRELYDLENDSGENHNLACSGNEIENKLWNEMQKH
jgi:arylsulfatase A-like enzyme